MRFSFRLFVLGVIVAASLTTGQAQPRLLEPKDFAALATVSEPQLSPDGALIAYVVRTVDLTKDKQPKHLWLATWDGQTQRPLTHGEGGYSHPRWSPDGAWLAFLSSRQDDNEADQVWLLPRDGGEARKLTATASGVEDFVWSPDSTRLVLVVRDQDAREKAAQQAEKDKKTTPPLVLDRYQFKQDIAGYLTGAWAQLHLCDVASGNTTALTSGPRDHLLPAWSPSGQELVYVSKAASDPDRNDNWDLFVIAAHPGAMPRQLTTSPEADAHPDWWDSAPAWSPDGQWIAYVHGGDPKHITYAATTLAIIPAAGGEPRVLTAALDRSIRQPTWTPDSRALLGLLEDDGRVHLVSVPLDGTPLTRLVDGRRRVSAFDVAPSGRIALAASTPSQPFELAALDADHALRPLTHHNDAFLASVTLATVDDLTARSPDGTEVHGFLVRPATAVASGTRPPALLRPHGGPQAQYAAEFNFEAQLFAAHGYSVILPNPRGSTGRGTAYALALHAAWGSVDVPDDLAMVDAAIAQGLADPDRLGVGGWSYGGMATNYLIASTTRFKAATSGASIANVTAGFGTDEYIRDYENELGFPWQTPETWLRISYPFFHADRIKTPTLFLCGESDFNVPLLNSEQMYQSLKALGLDTELVIYPKQFHGLTKPSYVLDRYQHYLAWYARFLTHP